MTFDEYKAYYDTGYKTDVNQINITDNTMEFVAGDKKEKFTYKYVGYKILTYKKESWRSFLFEATDANAGNYKYVQFSDHNIAPVKPVTSISTLVERAKISFWKNWKTGRLTTLLV